MRPRLLVIDDDQDIRDSLVSLLTVEGYEVVAAEGGKDALDRLAEDRYVAILLDLLMPSMTGVEFEAAIRANPEWTKVPVIICSAGAVPADVASRAFAVLQKPFDLDRLLDLLKAAQGP